MLTDVVTDVMRLCAAMLVGPDQARYTALCEALRAMSAGDEGESIEEIARRTGVSAFKIRRDRERFSKLCIWAERDAQPGVRRDALAMNCVKRVPDHEPDAED